MKKDPNSREGVYQAKEEAETRWFEDRPQVSLDLIAATGIGTDAAIVDVGAGASRLLDCLLEQGFPEQPSTFRKDWCLSSSVRLEPLAGTIVRLQGDMRQRPLARPGASDH
jgi:hypothetical protein